MKKLLLPLLLILSAGSVNAMWWRKKAVPAPTSVDLHKQELDFSAALKNGQIDTIKDLIAQKKVDVNKPLSLIYGGKKPLEVVFEQNTPNKFEIAQILLDAGAIDADGKAKAAIEGAKGNLTRLQELAKTAYEKALAALGAQQVEPTKPVSGSPESAAPTPQQKEAEPAGSALIQEPQGAKKKVIPTPKTTPKPAAARVQEVKVEIIPAAKPAATKQLVRPIPVSKPAPAQVRAPVTKAAAVPVNPAPAKAKWPSRPAPMRPVQQVPVSVLEEQGVPTARPVEELQMIGAR